MKWEDTAICLQVKPLGETKSIVTMLTAEHGVYAGVSKISRKYPLHPGNEYHATWTARLPEHLGQWQLESREDHLSRVFHDQMRLLSVASACSLIKTFLPERNKSHHIFHKLQMFLQQCHNPQWLFHYVDLEGILLRDYGYVLNWSRCAVTQTTNGLAYVSPQTGNVVCKQAAQNYIDKLIPLPHSEDVKGVLKVYGILFDRLYHKNESAPPLPKARQLFYEALL